MLIWEKDNSIVEGSEIRLSSHIKKRNSKTFKSIYPTTATSNGSVEPFGNPWSAKVGDFKVSDVRLPNPLDASGSDKISIKYSGEPPASSYAKEIVDEMSQSERLRYLQYALQVLHIAEFLVLVELTEVIIPIVYCIYLSIVYRLPNKVYHSQLRGVDDATLQRNLLSVMAYSLPELTSFLMLSYVLQRKVGISIYDNWLSCSARSCKSRSASSCCGSSPSGADFSFRFQWLHGNNSSIVGG